MNKEFATVKVNQEGIDRITIVRLKFNTLLEDLKVFLPEGREFSLVKTKLEEASFYAIKAISLDNQVE